MKQVGNTILAKGVNHILAKRDNSAWPKGAKLSGFSSTIPTRSDENWTLDTCFPFVKKDSHKKTSSKALVMAHAYSNVVMDKIEECIKNGLTGNEDDNW